MNTDDKSHHTTGARGRLAFLAAACLLLIGGLQTAGAVTYSVTNNALCDGAGTFEQAIKDANANPGKDTIVFAPPGMGVDVVSCTAAGHVGPLYPFSISATDSVDIIGNGARIHAGPMWFNRCLRLAVNGRPQAGGSGFIRGGATAVQGFSLGGRQG